MPEFGIAGRFARQRTRKLALRALMFLAAVVATAVVAGLLAGFDSWIFILVEIAAIAVMYAFDRRFFPAIERWDRGARGEEEVGKLLEGLSATGWHVLHDVSLGRGNIDHILIGPGGVLTVETKSHGGRIDIDHIDPRMLKQAYAQAKAVAAVTGEDASPLLVFSRAYLVPRPVSRQRGVVVLPARMIAGHLERRETKLNGLQAAAIRDQLQAQAV